MMKQERSVVHSIDTAFQFVFGSVADTNFTGYFHAHKGIELLYVQEGTGKVIVDQQIREIEPGMLIVFQPFQLHRTQMTVGTDTPYVRTIVTFDPEAIEPHLAAYPGLLQFLQRLRDRKLPAPTIRREELGDLYPQLVAHFGRHWAQLKPKHEEYPLLVIQLLHALQAVWPKEDNEPAPRPFAHSEQIMQWIERHYAEEIRLDELARRFHLSKHYMSRRFKRDTGSGIADYVNARRIRQAIFLLTAGDKSMRDIAEEVGFGSASYFGKMFLRSVGVTPLQYRQRAGQLFR